ncbi:3',5'-cyclic adenosine monophosphate phosphodiesterase CpdA [BD1-7 clade bacterium]|uniref:3',5'-cyclic adenosine monophosphate phosphodiesterase CpdA n=1 Tax=BD1-7 clade bacterium TaxID=2029982 RepID=A0A5S9N7N5_9GAMM|nr:3',5'-cyclic adenosine monophosphate phosphodiesterase CpdA [BD1-7 clade bacterium]CAA0085572.1 3',5'-cyclic adenosine monophosphate phosphodiesterase CpdA [BD1-7 clade bacterium]
MPLKVLQISDCHLPDVAGDTLLGLDTEMTLKRVCEHAFTHHPTPDLIALTGDITNGKEDTAYHMLREHLPTDVPLAWLPGNHDNNRVMQPVVSDEFLPSLTMGNWCLTFLDSSIDGAVPGLLEDGEVQRMDNVLRGAPDKHHLIFMHHHLKPAGCAWLDTQVVKNAPHVLGLMAGFRQLKAVAHGHVHQAFEQKHAHFDILACPSTCFQFKPLSDNFALDDKMPGYRYFELFDDGSYISRVERIEYIELPIDHKAGGY